jgi:hypothetical protein
MNIASNEIATFLFFCAGDDRGLTEESFKSIRRGVFIRTPLVEKR